MGMNLHLYKVGELYHPDRNQWPEGAQYNYRSGQHELLIFMNRPTGREINSVKNGAAEFALFVESSLILFCYRFLPELPWSDAPFSIRMVPDSERTIPEIPEPFEERHLLHVVLINAATGVISALRSLTFSPEFTAELHMAIRRQAELEYSQSQFDSALARVYNRYPRTEDLIPHTAARCDGGK